MRLFVFGFCLISTLSVQAGDQIKVERFFESSSRYVKALISVPYKMKVKCIVYDTDNNPIRVDSSYVTPPLDEVLIRTGDATSSAASVACMQEK